MKIELTIVAMSMMLLSSTLCNAAPGTVAGLPPELRDALLHDAACGKADAAPNEAAQARLLESAVTTQDIRSAAGATVGVIAAFSDPCHCREANCASYVYVKTGPAYKLAFSGVFTSLHPVRVFKRGYPSLTGKLQISGAQAESTVYDWNGKTYTPGLCATITQAKGRKAPSIVHHDCAKAP